MALATLINALKTRLGKRSTRPLEFLKSKEAFQHAALCERMRVDRNNSILSILMIELVDREPVDDGRLLLASILERQLRLTDTAGLAHDGRIGVLLPDTDEADAWKVATDVCEIYELEKKRPRCEVFIYPDNDDGDTPDYRFDLPEVSGPDLEKVGSSSQGSEAFFVRPPSFSKRMIDIAGALAGLAIAAPVICVVGLIVKLTSRGSVFYLQEREGIGGKRFYMYKLRSMHENADSLQEDLQALNEQDGPAFKIKKDPRTTAIGGFLRRTCIDELPQLLNVLKGEMSLVGPRPLPTLESMKCKPWQRQRLHVLPGLTCIWQVYGKNTVPFDQWMRMDLDYIDRQSTWFDLKLILQTAPSLVMPRRPHLWKPMKSLL